MRAPAFEGEVRLGVPYDIIGSFVPPHPAPLRQGAAARARQPGVRGLRASCATQLRSGGVDLALTTETECGRHGETLRTDRLVWVGVPGGEAHLRIRCRCRSARRPACSGRSAIEALGKARRDWRAVCEVSRLEPVYAAIEAGLAVAPLLRSSVPRAVRDPGRRARRACRRCPSSASTSMRRPASARPRATSPSMSARRS